MEVVSAEFCWDSITRINAAILVVAALNHEVVDYTVEWRVVVPTFVNQF